LTNHDQSSPVPPLPSFVFTLAVTGTMEEKAETGNLKREAIARTDAKIARQLAVA
jgi:hypothetical protein